MFIFNNKDMYQNPVFLYEPSDEGEKNLITKVSFYLLSLKILQRYSCCFFPKAFYAASSTDFMVSQSICMFVFLSDLTAIQKESCMSHIQRSVVMPCGVNKQ